MLSIARPIERRDASLYVPVWRAADLPEASASAKQASTVVADEGGFADDASQRRSRCRNSPFA